MKSTLYKLGTAVTSSALLLASAGNFAMAGQQITISGNGSKSTNAAATTALNTTFVTQTNNASINNNVVVSSDTGHNKANDNTGEGSIEVRSGNSTVDVDVTNVANKNIANVENCGCPDDLKVVIHGNGTRSENTADVTQLNTVVLSQDNYARVNNKVDIDSNTGHNKANDNTGSGDITVRSGWSDVDVDIHNALNLNVASIGSDDGTNGDGVLVVIESNGSHTKNDVNLDLLSTVFLDQSNVASVYNTVDVDSDTGHNKANDNTGEGDILVQSGNSTDDVAISTWANFNAASIDPCCPDGLKAEISKNGTESDNTIDSLLDNFLVAGQFNDAWVDNKTDLDNDTGHNKANDNTSGGDPFDPTVRSGDSSKTVRLSTMANHNVFGDADFELPDMDHQEGSLGLSLIWHLLSLRLR